MVSRRRAAARRLPRPSGPLAAGALTGAIAIALYALTLAADVGYWDTAEFQTVGPVLGIAHPTGFPSYTLLLWLASVVLQPFGEPALRANLLSAILIATGCGIVAAVVGVMTRHWLVGLGAGLALATAPTAWTVALHADPHAMHLALVALILALLVGWQRRHDDRQASDRWLLAAAVVFSVSLGNHALTLLLAPGIALFVLAVAPELAFRRRRFALACAIALALTTVVLYLYLPIRSAMNPPLDYANPQTWDGFWYVVLAEQFRGSLTYLPPLEQMLYNLLGFPLDQLGPVALVAPVGVTYALLRRRALLVLLAAWWLASWLFAQVYVNADIERYYLVPLTVIAILGGLGAGAAWDGAKLALRRLTGAVEGGIPTAVAGALAAALLIVPTLLAVPARHARVDMSHESGARLWLDTALPAFAPNAVVISWWSYSTPLWYAQFVEGRRPDVFVVDDRTMIDDNLGDAADVVARFFPTRPVYVIRLDPDLGALQQLYVLTPVLGPEWGLGAVYRVDGVRPVAA